MTLLLRPLRSADTPQMTQIIVTVSQESGVADLSYRPDEPDMLYLFEKFSKAGSAYWVVEDTTTGQLLGGIGYCPLIGAHPNDGITELQKLYLAPASRGLGIGKALLTHILDEVAQEGYKVAYLETAPAWKTAIKMYQAMGFVDLPQRLGKTNYSPALSVWMSKPLPVIPNSRQKPVIDTREMQCA